LKGEKLFPTVSKIISKKKENELVTTFEIESQIKKAQPGQFVMVWLPGFDEKPFSIAGISPLKLTVAAVGPFSKKFCSLNKGDKIWIRGPYGRGFSLKGKKILLVGGGYGFAPLRFLADVALKKGIAAKAICGAKSKKFLLEPACCETIYTTDDGSEGIKGTVLEGMKKLFEEEKFDVVYTCGPEKMMGAVGRLAKQYGAGFQLLLERYMKCAIGVCGHCACGEKLVCFDGPRFGYEIFNNPDFEKYWRDKTGKKVHL
jgi:dihydroorotate dehydrogenase electron transfer subunit